MEIILAIFLGGLFGFALHRVGATDTNKLLNMLSLKNLSLMKIILFAIGFSSLLLALSNFLGILDLDHLSIKTSHLGVLLGGLIFGLGFGWAGTCPGTCLAGTGGGNISRALATILGGLLGALAFSLTYGYFLDLGLFDRMNLGKLTLFRLLDSFPSVLSIGFGGLAGMGILLMGLAYMLPEHLRK